MYVCMQISNIFRISRLRSLVSGLGLGLDLGLGRGLGLGLGLGLGPKPTQTRPDYNRPDYI